MFLTLVMSVLRQSVWKTNVGLTASDKTRKWASRLRNPTLYTTVLPEKGGLPTTILPKPEAPAMLTDHRQQPMLSAAKRPK